MKTLRHYFISDDLNDLEVLEEQLEAAGVTTPQIHILSADDTGVAQHQNLHAVQSLMKKDVIHSAEVGALLGLIFALMILLVAAIFDLPERTVGWTPYVFLSIVALGFCTWEGGLFGIQETNVRFRQFEEAINSGRHVFFVDLVRSQEPTLASIVKQHPSLEPAGTERGTPEWILKFRNGLTRFVDRNLLSQSQFHHGD